MTTFTVNLLPKFLIIWEFSIISIVLSQWSEVTFTWVIIFLYQPHYQILWHKTPFFFFFIVISWLIAVSCQIFDTAEPVWIPKHLCVLRHAEGLSHSTWISSTRLVHAIIFRIVFGLGNESSSACCGSQKLLNILSRFLWCTLFFLLSQTLFLLSFFYTPSQEGSRPEPSSG